MDEIKIPEQMPEPGFYYHYKHDPDGPEDHYAYEFMGVGYHSEEEYFLAIYRPLYETARTYRLGRMYDIRPLAMFMETVTKDGGEMPRFARITDPELIKRLKEQCSRLYP